MSNRTYDILKYVCMFVLPALSALILSLGQIWSFPYYEQIALTVSAINTFLGCCLGISSSRYYKANNQL